MSKNEDQLKDLQRYREFLDKLTPREWLEDHIAKKVVHMRFDWSITTKDLTFSVVK